MPNRIGATVKAILSSRKAWATGSLRRAVDVGTGLGRSAVATVLMAVLLPKGLVTGISDAPRTELTSGGSGVRRRVRELHEGAQALVVLAASGAALEVLAHPGDTAVGVRA